MNILASKIKLLQRKNTIRDQMAQYLVNKKKVPQELYDELKAIDDALNGRGPLPQWVTNDR